MSEKCPASPRKTAARVYVDIVQSQPPSYSDVVGFQIPYRGVRDNYEIVRKIGQGKFSEVFQAIDVRIDKPCVLKVLRLVRRSKIKRELLILKTLNGGPGIIGLLDFIAGQRLENQTIVLEYAKNTGDPSFYKSMRIEDVKHYMKQLLMAVDYTHSKGIMHRDIKPLNIAIDRDRRVLKLLDWGLAEFYFPYTENSLSIASLYYKSPELLTGYKFYDYSLDMWSVGCIIAGLIFHQEPFFRGKNNFDQLVQIIKVLGLQDFRAFVNFFRIPFDLNRLTHVQRQRKMKWNGFLLKTNDKKDFADAIDLVDKLLTYDHTQRFTANEALQHKFFAIAKQSVANKSDV